VREKRTNITEIQTGAIRFVPLKLVQGFRSGVVRHFWGKVPGGISLRLKELKKPLEEDNHVSSDHRRAAGVSVLAVITAGLMSTSALAHRAVDPLPRQNANAGTHVSPFVAPPKVKSGTWAPLAAGFPGTSFPDTAQVMTDGTVLMHDGCTSDWYKLTPNKKGSYAKGKWTKVASMASNYKPLYFSSQVLQDGRLIAEGGEYNSCQNVHTTIGALYDPVKDSWTSVTPPSGWSTIGDAQSTMLPDGTYMQANCCTLDSALASISGTSVTWSILTSANTHKGDNNNEEGWTALPGQTMLTVDANRDLNAPNDVEIFDTGKKTWTTTGKTTQSLVHPSSHELGPAPLLPTGFVFQAGATGNNDVYDPLTGKWKAAPQFKANNVTVTSADGPAVVLPNGHALFQVSPNSGCSQPPFCGPSHFFEAEVQDLSTVTVTQVNDPASAPSQASYEGRLVILPTGQAFWTSDVGDIEIYSPKGKAKSSWLPTVTSSPGTVTRGSKNNNVQGTLFTGLTEGGYYGDDAQMATNFPLVRITNTGTGNVCYARTHDFSSRGIGKAGDANTAQFDVPNSCASGASSLEVVVNGVASAPAAITVN